jgi:hypothetical protein
MECRSEEARIGQEEISTPVVPKINKPYVKELKGIKSDSRLKQAVKQKQGHVSKNIHNTVKSADNSSTNPQPPLVKKIPSPKTQSKSSKKPKKKVPLQENKPNNKAKNLTQGSSTTRTISKTGPKKTITPNDLHKLKAQAIALEDAGNLLAAAQGMDRFLKMASVPTLEDLCYALDLNRSAPLIEQRKNRPHQLATLIAKHLNIDPQASEICIHKYSWQQFWPYLDYLIAETSLDPTYEVRQFKYKLEGQDLNQHTEWLLAHMRSYKYPIGISGRNYGSEGNKSAEGVWDMYHEELTINNYTQKETEARESFVYRFHGGKLDTTCLNPKTFYNLMFRAGFKEEDFKEGKHGFQDKVHVKPILLTKIKLEECYEELRAIISPTLKKTNHPYVAFIIYI